ncbi:hypothetical protein [Stenotrophomonas sp. SY1]|jgi:hypothetical protein|uniref:hypothetical protein n=1 Tax=Stenotrophomonas sp. SY1 TaxID=477235 RepID=UPI001E4C9DF7|nr:hypothetical protein [Stenotrophomonas sp. SY1]MCD9086359.1 hypothetical protein [Stenotrophomonas sp. SY1]
MEWIDDLEKETWNDVIDELVWHLRNGRMPTLITRQLTPDSGVEFRFKDLPAVFLPVDNHVRWDEAVQIIDRFPQLNATRIHTRL